MKLFFFQFCLEQQLEQARWRLEFRWWSWLGQAKLEKEEFHHSQEDNLGREPSTECTVFRLDVRCLPGRLACLGRSAQRQQGLDWVQVRIRGIKGSACSQWCSN